MALLESEPRLIMRREHVLSMVLPTPTNGGGVYGDAVARLFFCSSGFPLRDALTAAAARQVTRMTGKVMNGCRSVR